MKKTVREKNKFSVLYVIVNKNDIVIDEEEKTKETYEFVSQYLDILDFNDYITNPNLFQVVARLNNSIVGIMVFRMGDGKMHLNYSAVLPSERNAGLNKRMLDEVEKIASSNGINVITANVRESNTYSLRSLLSSGFEINQNYDMKYPDGEKKIPVFKKIK